MPDQATRNGIEITRHATDTRGAGSSSNCRGFSWRGSIGAVHESGPVTAIVVHREEPERLADTLTLLRSQGVALRVIVVDNGSSSATVAAVRGLLAEGDSLVETGANLGFGGGANAGLRRWLASGRGEWALVLPHDARPATDCLVKLVAAACARPGAGLASAEYGDDELPVVDPYFGGMTISCERGEGWQSTGFAHGTFLLVRRACIEKIGVFDERYFAYCEEADLSIRASRAGWDVGMVWGARVSNPHQSSPVPLVDYLMVRNTIVLVRRHFGRYHGAVRLVMAAGSTAWCAIRRSRRPPWFSLRARLLALRDAVVGRLGPPPATLDHPVRRTSRPARAGARSSS